MTCIEVERHRKGGGFVNVLLAEGRLQFVGWRGRGLSD